MKKIQKKVLLTGATGLIGKELIAPLKQNGFEIYAITTQNIQKDNVNWLKGDIFDELSIKNVVSEVKPEYLLNLAWVTTGDYLNSELNYKFFDAGKKLLQCFRDQGGKRALFAGTCFEYKFSDNPLREEDELDFLKTKYTLYKHRLHEYAEDFCRNNDISYGYGRIFYVYGKDEHKNRLTARVVNSLKNNQKISINNANLIRDYVYNRDVAGALVKFLMTNVQGVVNICTGKGISIKEYVSMIGRIMNKEDLITFIEDTDLTLPAIIIGNNERLINQVGYVFENDLEFNLKEILGI